MSANGEWTTPVDVIDAEALVPTGLLRVDRPPAHAHASGHSERPLATARPGERKRRKRSKRVDHRMDMRHRVTLLLAEGNDTQDALLRVCEALRDAMSWDDVTFWPADGHAGVLPSRHTGDGSSVHAEAVAVAVRTPQHTPVPPPVPLASRIAVVEHVFATRRPVSMTDLPNPSVRPQRSTPGSATPGACRAFAFPVQSKSAMLGVVECLSTRSRLPSAARLREAASLGDLIGRYLDRHRPRGETQPHLPPVRHAAGQVSPADPADAGRQLEVAFNTLADSVILFDREGRILLANAADCAMFGYDPDSTSGVASSLQERERLLTARDEHGQPLAHDWSLCTRILRGESLNDEHSLDTTLRTPDGRDLQVWITGKSLVDETGAVTGGVMVTRDITEQRLRERRLRDANQRLQESLAIAAHDLRTPISASSGYVQLALRRLNKLEALATTESPALVENFAHLRTNLENAQHGAQRLATLVGRLLDLAHIQTNKLEVRPQAVDLAAIIRTKVHEQRLAAPSRAIRFKVRPLRAVRALADPDRIGEVLLNYLANALKYSPESSPVEVTVDVREREARVSVRDAGPGIPIEERDRIWMRFQQLDAGQRRGSGAGLGLGLYISRAIVEAHGGHVGVESALGRGSTFWFDLPLAPAL